MNAPQQSKAPVRLSVTTFIHGVLPMLMMLVLAVGMVTVSGCREESPAMKKANLGRALMERGAVDKAIDTLQTAIKLDPDLVMSYEILGQAYEASGQIPKAVDAYRETVQRDPVRDTAYASLGCLLLSVGNSLDEAEQSLSKALEINQTHAGAHACMGAVYLERREFAEAIKSSERAASLNPQSIQAHLNLGIGYSETGDTDRARSEVKKVIGLAAGNDLVVKQAQMLLDSLNHPAMEGRSGGHG